ncbi:MAG: peptidoglycan-binding protein, partial [Actinomycetia bacterium]|nr:peptidoglycan-binding protein [Actinomycetes bacterium]
LTDEKAGVGLDAAPVTVKLTTKQASAVLAVPVGALLALAEGGYAVEKTTGVTTTTLVGVQTGVFAGGWVQVTGRLHEGDRVVTAQ